MRRSSGLENAIRFFCHRNFLLSTIAISANLLCTEDDQSQDIFRLGHQSNNRNSTLTPPPPQNVTQGHICNAFLSFEEKDLWVALRSDGWALDSHHRQL